MKLEIDLDMNHIDYDAINKQIQEKIADMDLATNWDIGHKIRLKIDEEIEDCVTKEFFRTTRWSTLNDSTKTELSSMLYRKAKEIIDPHVTDIINQIPEEEMNKIIADLIPKVLVDLISLSLRDTLIGYWNTSSETLIAEATNRIRSYMY